MLNEIIIVSNVHCILLLSKLLKTKTDQELDKFNGFTLDCETWLDTKLVQHLLSVAFFDGNKKHTNFISSQIILKLKK